MTHAAFFKKRTLAIYVQTFNVILALYFLVNPEYLVSMIVIILENFEKEKKLRTGEGGAAYKDSGQHVKRKTKR